MMLLRLEQARMPVSQTHCDTDAQALGATKPLFMHLQLTNFSVTNSNEFEITEMFKYFRKGMVVSFSLNLASHNSVRSNA